MYMRQKELKHDFVFEFLVVLKQIYFSTIFFYLHYNPHNWKVPAPISAIPILYFKMFRCSENTTVYFLHT